MTTLGLKYHMMVLKCTRVLNYAIMLLGIIGFSFGMSFKLAIKVSLKSAIYLLFYKITSVYFLLNQSISATVCR